MRTHFHPERLAILLAEDSAFGVHDDLLSEFLLELADQACLNPAHGVREVAIRERDNYDLKRGLCIQGQALLSQTA